MLIALGLAEASDDEQAQSRAGAARLLQTPQCSVLPKSDEFRRKVAGAEIHPRSRQIIDRIDSQGDDSLHPDFGAPREYGIPFVVVKHGQPRVPVRFTAYGSQSDKGPHPIPPYAPVEGGIGSDGDRHVLVVRRPAQKGGDCKLYELYRAFYRGGPKRKWSADSAAVFDLGRELPQRPRGLDLGRRGRPADLPRARSLRRDRPRPDQPRDPGHLRADAPRVHPARDPLRVGELSTATTRRWGCACGCGRTTT